MYMKSPAIEGDRIAAVLVLISQKFLFVGEPTKAIQEKACGQGTS